jgi:hypothetical protein
MHQRPGRGDRLRLESEGREERLTNPGPDETGDSLAALPADDVRGYGSSGRRFDAAAARDALLAGGRSPLRREACRVRPPGRDAALATGLARTAPAARRVPPSLRSSLRQRHAGTWRLVFHRVTRADAAEPHST